MKDTIIELQFTWNDTDILTNGEFIQRINAGCVPVHLSVSKASANLTACLRRVPEPCNASVALNELMRVLDGWSKQPELSPDEGMWYTFSTQE